VAGVIENGFKVLGTLQVPMASPAKPTKAAA
jgi:hypothetical protein